MKNGIFPKIQGVHINLHLHRMFIFSKQTKIDWMCLQRGSVLLIIVARVSTSPDVTWLVPEFSVTAVANTVTVGGISKHSTFCTFSASIVAAVSLIF